MSKYPSQTQDKFTVRFPDGMRDLLASRAAENGRSMNSEIIHILSDALIGNVNGDIEVISKKDNSKIILDGSIDSAQQVAKILRKVAEMLKQNS